jgi:hypothetical protein
VLEGNGQYVADCREDFSVESSSIHAIHTRVGPSITSTSTSTIEMDIGY